MEGLYHQTNKMVHEVQSGLGRLERARGIFLRQLSFVSSLFARIPGNNRKGVCHLLVTFSPLKLVFF